MPNPMPPWRETALHLFPHLADLITGARDPYHLWTELSDRFEVAYEESPPNEDIIRRTYAFADWCIAQPRGKTAADDLLTCVAVCFYEDIPAHPLASRDMPRWFTLQEFTRAEKMFRYHLTDAQFQSLLTLFRQTAFKFRPNLHKQIAKLLPPQPQAKKRRR